ncbi:AraC family transcriptional regulator [Marinomonas rhizomae]|uniref:AraC-like DNA-binding protein n=1 Tax=Marinomonas rhizomae TaxID=491948 RepID=A0A366IW81_9GAMM|nr:AraC family transcriptional regulator [Marinomonas rhizomae]RBP79032.1 AraC-like DNA-binding protein [Marinomonas rhizomae]RNF71256.1 AraC family transcriptional regulator [Marinomonas rhizomae]
MDELLYIGIAHASFIALFLFSKENRSLSDNILMGWIIFLALPLAGKAMSCDMLHISIPLLTTNFIYPLTFGPFLWLYLNSLIGGLQSFQLKHLSHFAPFLVLTFIQLTLTNEISFPHTNQTLDNNIQNMLVGTIILCSLFSYSTAALWRLHKHSKEVVNHFSTLSGKITLKWLNYITIAFVISYIVPAIGPFFPFSALIYSHAFAFTMFIFILSFFGLKQTQIYPPDPVSENTEIETEQILSVSEKPPETLRSNSTDLKKDSDTTNQNKYERSGLDEERARRYVQRLLSCMAKEKPYLDATLTVEKLAKQIAIPRHYTTQIISEQLNRNFYLFINEYRIESVKQIMQQAESENMSVLEIAYVCGFNSKSTFNTAFKKITKMTPSQYRKSLVRN